MTWRGDHISFVYKATAYPLSNSEVISITQCLSTQSPAAPGPSPTSIEGGEWPLIFLPLATCYSEVFASASACKQRLHGFALADGFDRPVSPEPTYAVEQLLGFLALEGKTRFEHQVLQLKIELEKIGKRYLEMQALPISKPNPQLRRQILQRKSHRKANIRGLSALK
jgi:hypothetical protein